MALTLRKQLKDPYFAAWMKKQPRRDTNPPYDNWRVFVQRKKKGPWARKDFHTYAEAYTFVMRNLDRFYDMALASKLYTFKPPMVRSKLTDKVDFRYPVELDKGIWWCPFCRRVTRFAWFKRHHNMKPWLCGHTQQCGICAASLKFASNPKEWKW